jgi:hypothetical protein
VTSCDVEWWRNSTFLHSKKIGIAGFKKGFPKRSRKPLISFSQCTIGIWSFGNIFLGFPQYRFFSECPFYVLWDNFLKINIFKRRYFFAVKLLECSSYHLNYVHMGRFSDWNSVVPFFCKYFVLDQKISKMVITFEWSNINPNPLTIFLRIMNSTYGQNIVENGVDHLGTILRYQRIKISAMYQLFSAKSQCKVISCVHHYRTLVLLYLDSKVTANWSWS